MSEQPSIQAIGRNDMLWLPEHIGRETSSGITVNAANSMKHSAVWAATSIYAGVGSLPLNILHRSTKQPLRIRESQVVRCLRWKANPELESGNFFRLMWQWQVNWGNADAEKVIDDYTGETVALYPLEPWRTTCERSPSGELRWRYREESGEERVLSRDKVFHVPNVLTTDGNIGIGVLQAAREAIGLGLATEKYGSRFFGGDGIPRGVVEHPGAPLTPEMRAQWHQEWEAIYGGPNRRRVALLGGGSKYSSLQINAEDSQFLETRQFNAEDIARFYRVPPHLIQRMVQVTYNNAELLPIDFVKWTLNTYFLIWEGAINTQLLGEDQADDYQAKYNETALLRGDSAARANFFKTMTGIGAMSRNEVRALEDMEPIQGGDTILVQGATVPLDENGKPESEFTGNAGPQQSQEQPVAKGKVVAAVRRALFNDLHRMTTKEGNAAVGESKKPDGFVSGVDKFYASHAATLTAAIEPHFEVLSACGLEAHVPEFVASWCEAGKESLLSAAGAATPDRLESSVRAVVDSRDWSDRPLKAITSLE